MDLQPVIFNDLPVVERFSPWYAYTLLEQILMISHGSVFALDGWSVIICSQPIFIYSNKDLSNKQEKIYFNFY
jgi:hypothetical protein